MTDYDPNPDHREPNSAWKANLLAVLLIFAFAAAASLTFLR
jgi:hypothetical protein